MTGIEKATTDNTNKIDNVTLKVDKTTAELEKLKDDVKEVKSSSGSNSSESVFSEIRDRKVREQNIIIHGMLEPSPAVHKGEDRKETQSSDFD